MVIILTAGISSSSSDTTPTPAAAGGRCFTSIFSFGDSITDTGNHCHILSKAGRSANNCLLPYGETFFHRPTGRSSDGRLIIDFIAEHLGIPLVQPYFGGGSTVDFDGGVNFAVGTATALDSDFLERRAGVKVTGTNVSLNVQLDHFRRLIPSLCRRGTDDCNNLFRNSLFILGEIGGNDYNFALSDGHSLKQVQDLVPLVVGSIISALKEIIELGAVNILVPGNFPMGCLPFLLNKFPSTNAGDFDPSTGCLTWVNEFVEYHNDLLQTELDRIRELHPADMNIIYVDYYNALLRIYQAPKQFGFSGEPLAACCEGEGSVQCGSPSVRPCEDPSAYVNWDGIHFTEATYRVIAKSILEEGLFTNPQFSASSCIAGNSGKAFPNSF
ncbi:unnamed protein product [Linum tenue]|uniref:Uncharacterized protein n=1 Tax=Linum tenue TaxID=586396 RepID=A0AAV0M3H3_9ROSI|nr:unnamed protein product [Linum tenue]